MSDSILEDNPQTVEMLKSMKRLWNWARTLPRQQRRRFFAALAECSDELQETVLRLVAVVENPDSAPADRKRAMMTIADTLFLNPDEDDGQIGMDAQEATFAQRLRTLLESKGISQGDLAERIGCSQPAISQMLTRNCRPQKNTILKLAEALHVNPRELWPDLETADMLDAVASFQQDDYSMTEAEARALRDKERRNRSKVPARTLPKRRR
jgi:transcriptional regulator with XRE-family HTH domain